MLRRRVHSLRPAAFTSSLPEGLRNLIVGSVAQHCFYLVGPWSKLARQYFLRSGSMPHDQVEIGTQFNRTEAAALAAAAENGWLTVTSEIGDRALTAWQHACEDAGKAFAVARLEPQRVSLWFILTGGREWSQLDQARILQVLADTTGYVITCNNVRAFARLGAERIVMEQLLAASSGLH